MSRFIVSETPLSGLKVIQRQRLGDKRGFFCRMYCSSEFSSIGWNEPLAQINHSSTAQKGTVRGMHFQYPPYAEIKLVSCLRGEIMDVVVDVRTNSPTFLQNYSVRLSADNNTALMVPQGFAHGFQTLTSDVELLYLHSAPYNQESEGGLNPTDPALAIKWPLAISQFSEKDSSHPLLENDFKGVRL